MLKTWPDNFSRALALMAVSLAAASIMGCRTPASPNDRDADSTAAMSAENLSAELARQGRIREIHGVYTCSFDDSCLYVLGVDPPLTTHAETTEPSSPLAASALSPEAQQTDHAKLTNAGQAGRPNAETFWFVCTTTPREPFAQMYFQFARSARRLGSTSATTTGAPKANATKPRVGGPRVFVRFRGVVTEPGDFGNNTRRYRRAVMALDVLEMRLLADDDALSVAFDDHLNTASRRLRISPPVPAEDSRGGEANARANPSNLTTESPASPPPTNALTSQAGELAPGRASPPLAPLDPNDPQAILLEQILSRFVIFPPPS